MLSSNHNEYYIIPETSNIQCAVERAKTFEFRAIWNLYTGTVITQPKSSGVVFGVDLGIYNQESAPMVILDCILNIAAGFELAYIQGPEEDYSRSLFNDYHDEESDPYKKYYTKIIRGAFPLDFISESNKYYKELKEVVDRRSDLYVKNS